MSKIAIDPADLERVVGTNYPSPYDEIVEGREKRVLGDAFGLDQFGVNLVTLSPGSASAQRHWHTDEDEFIYVLAGTATLVTDEGKQALGPGMSAGFAAGAENGHHLVNETDADVVFLEVGTRAAKDFCKYPEADLLGNRAGGQPTHFTHRDGSPFEEQS